MADQSTPQEETVATYIPFAELCGFLEKVQRKQGSDNKKAIFKSFLEKWRECHTQLHKNNPNVVGYLQIVMSRDDGVKWKWEGQGTLYCKALTM